MVIVKIAFAKTDFFPWQLEGNRRRQNLISVSPEGKCGTSPVWRSDDLPGEDREAGYNLDDTGSFITDWEVHVDLFEKDKKNNPGFDFIVDWKS